MASAAKTLNRRSSCLVVFVLLATGCGLPQPPQSPQGSAPQGEGPGRRQQPLALSPQQEWAVGQRAYREVLGEVRDRILPDNSREARRVSQIVARLAKAAENKALQREIVLRNGYRYTWQTHVVRDKQINAFCLPAGFIFVYTGILGVTGENDNFLATVLSHEMAHALAHHASERVARERSGDGVLRSLSYGRMQESEADKIGVFLMPFAGFDPGAAAGFWQKMQAATGGGGRPEFLSDHPNPENRARSLQEWAPRARAAKQAFDEGRIAPPGRRAAFSRSIIQGEGPS